MMLHLKKPQSRSQNSKIPVVRETISNVTRIKIDEVINFLSLRATYVKQASILFYEHRLLSNSKRLM